MKFLRDKRGDEPMLLKEVFGIILTSLIIIGFIWLLALLLGFGGYEKEQAAGLRDNFNVSLGNLKTSGATTSILVYAPKDWYLITSVAGDTKFTLPAEYREFNSICICPDSWGHADCLKSGVACGKLEAPFVDINGQTFSHKITDTIQEFQIKFTGSSYEVENIRTFSVTKLECDKNTKLVEKFHECSDTFTAHSDEYKGYISATPGGKSFNENFIKAIICQESEFNQNDIGTSGEIGLMQIMPQNALDDNKMRPFYDLPAPDGKFRLDVKKSEDEASLYNWHLYENNPGYKEKYVAALNALVKTSTAEQLIAADKRFDPSKNIELGVKLFNDALNAHNGERDIALADYNAGSAKAAACNPTAYDATNCPQAYINNINCLYEFFSKPA